MKWSRFIAVALLIGGLASNAFGTRASATANALDKNLRFNKASSFYVDGGDLDTTRIIRVPRIQLSTSTSVGDDIAWARPDTGRITISAASVTGDSGNVVLALDMLKWIDGAWVKIASNASFVTMFMTDKASVVTAETDTLNGLLGVYATYTRALPIATVWKWAPDGLRLRRTDTEAETDSVAIKDWTLDVGIK